MTKPNLYVINDINRTTTFQYQYEECNLCLFNNISMEGNGISPISVISHLIINIVVNIYENRTHKRICTNSFTASDSIVYNYSICNKTNGTYCYFIQDPYKVSSYMLPFYIFLVAICFSAIIFYLLIIMYRYRLFQKIGSKVFMYKVDLYEDLGNPRVAQHSHVVTEDEQVISKPPIRKRIKSIDTFRGIAIVLMIFVNYGGGKYWFMEHSPWNGLTVADLVFPWFVFLMGVTVALSLFKLTLKKKTSWILFKFWLHAVKRTIILFVLGICIENPETQLSTLRIMGVLQRLAFAYFFLTSFICLFTFLATFFKPRPHITDIERELLQASNEINLSEFNTVWCRIQDIFPDIFRCFPIIVFSCGLLILHACISLLVVYPDNCPKGYLGPGGLDSYGCCENCTGGIAGSIDRLILTSNHMYNKPTCSPIYKNKQSFDPEGILGILTCNALCFLGYWAGNLLLIRRDWVFIVKRLFIYSLICVGIGVGLCQCRTNGGLIPINKNLWSVSYVLVTAGTSFFILAVMFTIVDALHLWSGLPFKYPGMNGIALYVGHSLLLTRFPVQWNLKLHDEHTYNLIMNVWGTVFWIGMAFIMYLKNLFITI